MYWQYHAFDEKNANFWFLIKFVHSVTLKEKKLNFNKKFNKLFLNNNNSSEGTGKAKPKLFFYNE